MTKSQNQPNTVIIPRICHQLRQIHPSTEHGRRTKSNIIAQLFGYHHSTSLGEVDLGSLGAAVIGLGWLIDHIVQIDDRQVSPTERAMLCEIFAVCQHHYDTEKSL